MNDKITITISINEYKRLLESQVKLDALECNDICNWNGYDCAFSNYEQKALCGESIEDYVNELVEEELRSRRNNYEFK